MAPDLAIQEARRWPVGSERQIPMRLRVKVINTVGKRIRTSQDEDAGVQEDAREYRAGPALLDVYSARLAVPKTRV
jgi:hypothetical protein